MILPIKANDDSTAEVRKKTVVIIAPGEEVILKNVATAALVPRRKYICETKDMKSKKLERNPISLLSICGDRRFFENELK